MSGAAAAPRGAAGAHPRNPRVGRIAARRFAGRSELSLDPDLRVYLGDLVRPYGVALREDLLERGVGHTYAEMAEELIRDVVTEDEPIDLVILTYAMHDVRPGQSTALYLSDVCPGRPQAFTVCDQGIAGPYTAVRIASEYLRTGNVIRALIVIAEQDALHYEPLADPDVPPVLPEGHHAVAVLFDGIGTPAVSSVREHAGTAPDDVRDLLATQITELTELAELTGSADPERRVLVLGGGLSKDDVDGLGIDRVIAAPTGQPCTGVWHELAQNYTEWAQHGALVTLADYDRQLRTLCLCTIDTLNRSFTDADDAAITDAHTAITEIQP